MGGNILITSAAAKVLLVRAFKMAAAHGRKVFAGDLQEAIAARHAADGFVPLLRDSHADFIPDLIRKCRDLEIEFIIPTRDGELEPLARAHGALAAAGIRLNLAPLETIRICRDKRAFATFCAAHGLPCPPHLTLDEARRQLPVFIRPVDGAGGKDARKIETVEALAAIEPDYDAYIVNAFVAPYDGKNIEGAREYTIDLLRSLDGRTHVGAVVRERIRIESGESQHARVVDLPEVEKVAVALGDKLGLVGHNTVQVFDIPDRGPSLIEVNPRFGGAANLGIRAGLNSPGRLLAMLTGDPAALEPCVIRHGMEMFRFKDDFIIEPDGTRVSGSRE